MIYEKAAKMVCTLLSPFNGESTAKTFFTTKDTKYTKEFFKIGLKSSNIYAVDL